MSKPQIKQVTTAIMSEPDSISSDDDAKSFTDDDVTRSQKKLLSNYKIQHQNLKEQISTLEEQLQEKSQENTKAEEQIERLKGILSSYEKKDEEIQVLKKKLEDSATKSSIKTDQISTQTIRLMQKKEQLQQENQQLRAKLKDPITREQELKKQILALQQTIKECTQPEDQPDSKTEQLSLEKIRLLEDNQRLEAENKKLMKQVEAKPKEQEIKNELKKKINELKMKIEKLEQENRMNIEEADEKMKIQRDEYERKLAEGKQLIEEMKRQVEIKSSEMIEIRGNMHQTDEAAENIEKLQEENKMLKDLNQQRKAQVAELEDQIRCYQQELQNSKAIAKKSEQFESNAQIYENQLQQTKSIYQTSFREFTQALDDFVDDKMEFFSQIPAFNQLLAKIKAIIKAKKSQFDKKFETQMKSKEIEFNQRIKAEMKSKEIEFNQRIKAEMKNKEIEFNQYIQEQEEVRNESEVSIDINQMVEFLQMYIEALENPKRKIQAKNLLSFCLKQIQV